MRNKRLVKTAVCGAILSASLMVSQQNINAAQEGSALSSEAKKMKLHKIFLNPIRSKMQQQMKISPRIPTPIQVLLEPGIRMKKQMTQKKIVQRIQMLPLTEWYLTSLQMRAISPFL